ncbi:PREDICTED: uncharacterized protein LOC108559728 [Nicrophorus vespilloides]|uniref:Uncharacterized protein LOC108559728 n=1 Tax=Nicrophorus vespilloides TaxID=110193 RepID=A0ABM1MDB2_NICVS|nr:PREDICTED: uncharacterized protein LOC108559728 [Nicrophorus vespilloides]
MKCVLIVVLAAAAQVNAAFPTGYDPICASNGKTYQNEAQFNLELQKDDTLTINFHGTCKYSGWDDYVCEDIGTLTMCGSDGINYKNDCLFHFALKRNPSLRWRLGGVCKSYLITEKVCGTDGVVYNVPKFLAEQSVRPYLGQWPIESCTGDSDQLQTPLYEVPTFCGSDLLIYEDPIFEAQQALRADLEELPLSDCYYKPYFLE